MESPFSVFSVDDSSHLDNQEDRGVPFLLILKRST
jgi:hypothetical protein